MNRAPPSLHIPPAPPARGAGTLLRRAGKALASLLLALSAAWGALALWYQCAGGWPGQALGALLWAGFGAAAIGLWWRRRPRILLVYLAGFAALLLWWFSIAPTHQRVWADDVARMLDGRVNGSVVTLQNVRNFDWRSDTDYLQRWETRSYDLDHLRSVDTAMSYWTGPAIAHTLVSFGFDDGRYLTFSIEIRKQRGESFSAVAGFFKRFETSLIAADERDILRVRTNARGEDMYLYRVAMAPAAMRAMFLSYIEEAASLRRTPRFYNTLTDNCTTVAFDMARRIYPDLPLDYRLLASGYLDEYLYDAGALMPGYTLAALQAAGHITARARAADQAPDFSSLIRRGMPQMAR